MSCVKESPDIIPGSPEFAIKETNSIVTPISRNQGMRMDKHNQNRLAGSLMSFKSHSSKWTSVSDSEDEVVLSSDTSSEDDRDRNLSIFKSVIASSELGVSQNISTPRLSEPNTSFVKATSSIESGKHGVGLISTSTPTFDPSTSVGEWRASKGESLSNNESPIGNPAKKVIHCLFVDSDSEDDTSSPGRRLPLRCTFDMVNAGNKSSNENSARKDRHCLLVDSDSEDDISPTMRGLHLKCSSDISNTSHHIDDSSLPHFNNRITEDKIASETSPLFQKEKDGESDISATASELSCQNAVYNIPLPSSDCESIGSVLSSTKYIETVDSPPEGKIKGIYAGKYKIELKEKDKLNMLNNRDLQGTSHSSVGNIPTSSTSSSRFFNVSNMSQTEIENAIKSNKVILSTVDVNALPDKGAKLRERIGELEEALVQLKLETKGENGNNNSSIYSTSKIIGCSNTSQPNSSINKNCRSPEIQVISEEKEDPSSDHLRKLKEKLSEKQSIFKATNPRGLPDGGLILRQSIVDLEKEIMMTELKAVLESEFKLSPKFRSRTPSEPDIIEETSPLNYKHTSLVEPSLRLSSLAQAMAGGKKDQQLPQHVLRSLYDVDRDYGAKDYGGKLSYMRERNMIRMTSDAVETLHRTLRAMPDVETAEEIQPEGIRLDLMPHQRRALRWLVWRESQVSPGGILADDMGLGKTLTMLALLLRHKELVKSGDIVDDFANKEEEEDSENSEHEEWLSKEKEKKGRSKLLPSKGTLVVCPATLLGQWEGEVKRHVKSKKLSVLVYHGNSRDVSLNRLSQYDLVITTYQLVMREAFSAAVAKTLKKNVDAVPEIEAFDQGPLFRVGWCRIILDEAHQIRNHKSKTSQSVCMLRGGRRWAVTGTPVQNREMDFFSLVRFLRVSPFDDYTCWKHQLVSSSAQGLRKLNLLVRALLLRRTKDQVDQSTGETIVQLPPKEVIQHKCSLGQEEREVYDRVFTFSRSSLIEYMKSQEEKERERAERSGQTFKPQCTFTSSNKGDKYTPTLQAGILKANELKAHHMLVLLLRLRQICCHPALIRSIIDDDAKAAEGLSTETNFKDDLETHLITQMNAMSLQECIENEVIDNRIRDEILNASNPVFKKKTLSTKISRVIEELIRLQEEEDKNEYEKAVIVSQWTSMLEIVYKHLKRNNIKASAITGQIPVKDRASIVDEFNAEGKGPRVLLLSLSAGGVGLNLVGANHLFLLDIHWNPQLESQACDRIYRVGQKRPVKIHRFVVVNSVEEKILELQQKKLELADAVLTGAKRSLSNKLTLQDIKALFSVT